MIKKILAVCTIFFVLFLILRNGSITEEKNERELDEFLENRIDDESEKIRKEIEEIYLKSPLFLKIFPENLNSEEIQLYIDEIQAINNLLGDIHPLLRDDFLKLIFKLDLNSEKTIEELRNIRVKIEKQVGDFLKVYTLLPQGIREGVEDSRSIGNVNSITELTGIIIDLLIKYQNLPSDIKNIVPDFSWIKDGFEIEEIKEFNEQISLNFDDNTFREWFVKNYFLYDVSNLKNSWNDFLILREKDNLPPEIDFSVRIDDDLFFENESPDTVIKIFAEDDLNRIKTLKVYIGEYTETLKGRNSLYFSDTLRFKLELGKYEVTVEAMDSMGNTVSKKKEYEYYPDVYTIDLELYDSGKLDEIWKKARDYRPIQPYPKEDLGFEAYSAYILGEKMGEYYEDIKNSIMEKDPVEIAKRVNAIINRGYLVQIEFPEVIKKIPLKSGVCGYDAEVQVIILNNLYRDYGINASAFLIPASKSGGVVDHSEVFLHTESGDYLIGSNYEGVYKIGEDPYSKDTNLVLMGEEEWFKLAGAEDAFFQALSGMILPYRPDRVAIERFYKSLDIIPIYPYIDIRNELLKSHYVVYPSYVNFIVSDEYVSQSMEYIMEHGIDEKVLLEANKLESARRYWYYKKGYKLYEGKNPEAYILLIPSSNFNATFVYINARTPEVKKFVEDLKLNEKVAYEKILSLL